MEAEIFKDFRLVGGTALSLKIGHRISVDIDLFSDAEYGTIDFDAIGLVYSSVMVFSKRICPFRFYILRF